MRRLVITLVFLTAFPVLAGSGPPREVLERLGAALGGLEAASFAGEYIVSTTVVTSKPNGESKHQELIVEKVKRRRGQGATRELVRAVRDGNDTTADVAAKRRKKKQEAAGNEGNDDASHSVMFSLPTGDDLAGYDFQSPVRVGDAMVAAFSPPPEVVTKDGAGSGRLAWDPDSLDPVWLELTPVKNPRHVKKTTMRLEFARADGHLYTRRTRIEAVGGFLFIKRRLVVDIVVSGLVVREGAVQD